MNNFELYWFLRKNLELPLGMNLIWNEWSILNPFLLMYIDSELNQKKLLFLDITKSKKELLYECNKFIYDCL